MLGSNKKAPKAGRSPCDIRGGTQTFRKGCSAEAAGEKIMLL